MAKMITWDKLKYQKLRKAYNKAVKAEEKQFTFDGDGYVTAYAKYLLDYLQPKFRL